MRLIGALSFCFLLNGPPLIAQEASSPAALVVTSPELADHWKTYAEWKTRLGTRTRIVTTDAIDKSDSDQEADLQEKIRRYVRLAIDSENVKAVIIGGDSLPGGKGHVPDRDTLHQTMWGRNADIPTDIFFLSQGTWDADGDGVFGEFEEDRAAINYPDGSEGIGRIPVRTPADVAAYVEKVIAYDSAFPTGEFAERMIYTCAVPGAEAKLGTSWGKGISKSWTAGKGEMFYTSRTPWDRETSGDFALSPKHMVELINKNQVGKFHIHGHGLGDGWILEDDEKLGYASLRELTNRGAYPIITTVSCFTGFFDSGKDPCITEAMLRLPQAGAIAILAPCREGKPHFTDPKRDFPLMMSEGKMDGTTETMTRFWKHALTDAANTGTAFTRVKADLAKRALTNANFHMAMCELNFLGDPLLVVHATSPKTIPAKMPQALKTGKQVVTMTDLPVGTIVTISDGKKIYGQETADASGKVDISVTVPEVVGKMSVGLVCRGYNGIVKHF